MTPSPRRGLHGDSETARRLRDHDWSAHPLGEPADWPPLLRQTVNLMLASPESLYLLWGEAMHFFSNDAYRPILGPRLPDAIGTTLARLWPDAIEAVRPSIEAARRGEAARFTDVPITMARQGVPEDTWWSFSFSPVPDDEGTVRGVLCHTVETTERVLSAARRDRAEERLRTVNQRLEAEVSSRTRERNRIWEASRDMLMISDGQGVWTSVNPAWTATLGWAEDELVGRTSEWIEHPEDRQRTRDEIARLATGQTTFTFENRLRTRDGEYRRLSWTAVPRDGVFYCVARDVTLEHERALALAESTRHQRESEARARAYFLTSPEFVLLLRVDAAGAIVVEDINPAVEALFGLSREQAMGAPLRTLVPSDSADDVEPRARDCLRSGQRQVFTAQRAYPGRRELLVESVMALVERHEDGGGLVLVIARDRTDQWRAEEQLRQAQKMEALGQLTGGVAHDFNNLLSTLTSSLEVIRRKIDSGHPQDAGRFIAMAHRATQAAASLTHRLLAFSRKQALDLRAVDVHQLTRGLEDLLRRTLGEQVAVELRLADDAWWVRTDAHQLESALLNLAINARDAMPDGGALTIETETLRVDDDLTGLPELATGDYLVISVSDNGVGMAPEVIERAFDPFFTTKDIGKGTGLGLSMIYGYARQSGGHAAIFSLPGQGTTVKLFLPRADEGLPHGPAEPPLEPRPGGGERLLLVDDNTDLREVLQDALAAHGYAVTAAPDADSALRQLEQGRFDLLITDIGLPTVSGRQLVDLAHARWPGLPVLMISGYAKEAAARADFIGPGMAMLSKPFALSALTRKAQELLRRP